MAEWVDPVSLSLQRRLAAVDQRDRVGELKLVDVAVTVAVVAVADLASTCLPSRRSMLFAFADIWCILSAQPAPSSCLVGEARISISAFDSLVVGCG